VFEQGLVLVRLGRTTFGSTDFAVVPPARTTAVAAFASCFWARTAAYSEPVRTRAVLFYRGVRRKLFKHTAGMLAHARSRLGEDQHDKVFAESSLFF